MKKNLRYFLLITTLSIIGSINAIAQIQFEDLKYPFLSDSLVYEEYDQGSWVIDSRQKYVLFPDRRPDYMLYYDGTGSMFYTFDYIWDGTNISGLDLKVNFGGQEMVMTEMRLIRDAQGNVIEELVKELDQPGSPLVNSERTLYVYDAQNRLIEERSEDWNKSLNPAAWEPTSKSYITNDANGKPLIRIDSSYSNGLNAFFFGKKQTFEYDANSKVTFIYNKNELDAETGRRSFIYNSAGYLLEEKFEAKNGGNYTLNSKDSIILDADNKITQQFEYVYDFTVGRAVLSERMNAQGALVGIFSNSKMLKHLQSFPNPTDGKLDFKLEGNLGKEVEVFNILGEKVLNLTLSSTENSIDLSDLTNGIYTVKVKAGNTYFQNKVVLSK